MKKNKNQLIKELLQIFRSKGFEAKQAIEDAYALIINSAIKIAEENKSVNLTTGEVQYNKTVIIVGQDIDLLVLLNQLSPINSNIYFFKPGSGNVNDSL